jgi:hypothetical protein
MLAFVVIVFFVLLNPGLANLHLYERCRLSGMSRYVGHVI